METGLGEASSRPRRPLAHQDCDRFIAPGTEANLVAIEEATARRTTPIVIVATDCDPIATRHVSNLARPGDRITGERTIVRNSR